VPHILHMHQLFKSECKVYVSLQSSNTWANMLAYRCLPLIYNS